MKNKNIQALLISLLSGVLVFSLELLLRLIINSYQMNLHLFHHFLVINFLIYLIFYGILGLILGFSRSKLYLVLPLYFSIGLISAAYLNRFFLPEFFKAKSIIANFILLSLFFLGFKLIRANKLDFLKLSKILISTTLILFMFSGAGIIKLRLKDSKNISPSQNLNVLIILIDALRPDHLSCYGYQRKTSPAIDEFASQSLIFKQAFAQSSNTFASVPSLLMSLYPATHNMRDFDSHLPKEYPTIFKIMKEQGYRTGIFSEHAYLGEKYGYDQTQGVDINYTKLGKWPEAKFSLCFSLRSIIGQIAKFSQNFSDPLPGPIEVARDKLDDLIFGVVDGFNNFIKQNQREPFFAYIHLMKPHAPYRSPRPYRETFRTSPGKRKKFILPEKGFFPYQEGGRVSQEQLRDMIESYDEEILYTDQEQIAKIFQSLKKHDLWDKTLIIVTSDHAEQFYEHKQWMHGNNLFRSVIQVPLIIKLPGSENKPFSIKQTVSLIDLTPTILDFANINKPVHLEGESLRRLLEAKDYQARAVYSEVNFKDKHARSLIKDNLHLIYTESPKQQKLMFFDLAEDPEEINDLSNQNRPEIQAMQSLLNKIHKDSQNKAVQSQEINLDQELKEHFKSLGYVQ